MLTYIISGGRLVRWHHAVDIGTTKWRAAGADYSLYNIKETESLGTEHRPDKLDIYSQCAFPGISESTATAGLL